ncbi:hypothetical protein BH10BAC1_BH10BAC1_09160 [soil metagenome]
MRKAIFVFISVCISIISTAQTVGVLWGSPINVGIGTTHNNIYPRLTLTSGDNPLVVWEDNSPAKIYSSYRMGPVFSAPIALNNSGISPYVATWTGAEIASSGDTAFVVFTSMPVLSGNAYAVRTIDGGLTFSDTVRVNQFVGKIPSFPSVAVLPGGIPLVDYMYSDAGTMLNTEYTVCKSIDGGLTFLPEVTPINPGTVCECCPASMAVSGNTQVLLYRNNISNVRDIWASFSTDSCSTFSASAEIDTTNWLITSCPTSGPTGVIINDSLVYSWMSDATGDARIYIGTMNINDQQIGQHRQLYPVGVTTQNYPVLAGKGDTLGIVWLGYNGGYQDVLFSWSLTGASGLGTVVDTITKGTTGHQSRPDLVFNNGKFHLVYSTTVGTQVQYLEGTIVQNVSVSEINSSSSLSFTATNWSGVMEMQINSSKELNAEVFLLNALGQQIIKTPLTIKTGSQNYSMQHQLNSGIYFISVVTSDGNVVQKKICVIN